MDFVAQILAFVEELLAYLGEFDAAGIIDVKKLITAEFSLDEIDKGMELAMAAQGLKNVINMD